MQTPLERREARPTSTIVFLCGLFALPIGSCGGIGTYLAAGARSEVFEATPAQLVSPEVEVGTFVRTKARLRHIATDELPLANDRVVIERGGSLFGVAGEADIVLYCEGSRCAPLYGGAQTPVSVSGQICDDMSRLRCDTPPGLKAYLRDEERHGAPKRVMLVGREPGSLWWEAGIGLGVAGLLVACLIAVVIVLLRARHRPRLSVQRSFTMRGNLDAVRASLLATTSAMFRLAADRGDTLVFLAGLPASRAQLLGTTEASQLPRRVAIVLKQQPYHPTVAEVTVTELLATRIPGPLAEGVKTSLESAMQELEQHLGVL